MVTLVHMVYVSLSHFKLFVHLMKALYRVSSFSTNNRFINRFVFSMFIKSIFSFGVQALSSFQNLTSNNNSNLNLNIANDLYSFVLCNIGSPYCLYVSWILVRSGSSRANLCNLHVKEQQKNLIQSLTQWVNQYNWLQATFLRTSEPPMLACMFQDG